MTGGEMVVRFARALTLLVYAFVMLALVVLGLGFFLLLFGANPEADFAQWVYRALDRVMAPFRGLFEPVPIADRSVFDLSILFAMIVYGVVGLALGAVIDALRRRITQLEQRHPPGQVGEAPAPRPPRD